MKAARPIGIVLSRWHVRRGRRLILAGKRLIEREERLWGLADPGWEWRVPNVVARRF